MMKHTLLYIAVSGMTLLTSCQLGKHYTRPDLHLPQQLDTLRQQDTLSIACLLYTSPSPRDCS